MIGEILSVPSSRFLELRHRIALCGILAALAALPMAHAQLRVDLELKRSLYIRHEPVIAFVNITNLTGRDVDLVDDGNHKWFSFQIETGDGRLIPAYDTDYHIDPISIAAGSTVRRAINLTPIYPLSDYGMYRVRATIYLNDEKDYFSSAPLNIEITEGRLLWQEKVGVPASVRGGPGIRTVSVLAHRLPANNQLYIRIEDDANGVVYCTHQLGRFVSFGKPEVELDAQNNVHVFQATSPKTFMYSRIGLGGEVLERKQYTSNDRRPQLRRAEDGSVSVLGGIPIDPNAAPGATDVPLPSIADRPVALPSDAGATPDPTPDRPPSVR
ncbi:MAG: hypothetical protein ACOVMP_03855 [Chthoniobacterales bacterium]